jgi:hypothetical protein
VLFVEDCTGVWRGNPTSEWLHEQINELWKLAALDFKKLLPSKCFYRKPLLFLKEIRLKISEPGTSVSTVSGYGLDDREIEVRSAAEAKGFFL